MCSTSCSRITRGRSMVVELIILLALAFSVGYGLRSYLSYRRRGYRSSRFPYF
jgi:hypothetical protein